MSYESFQYSDWSCCFIPVRPDRDLWDQQVHSHTTEELLLIVTKGYCTIDSNGSTYRVPTPAFIWNRAGSYHRITNVPQDTRTSFLVAFTADLLEDIPQKLHFTEFMDGHGLFALSLNTKRLNHMKGLFHVLINSPLTQRQLLLPCIFHQITLYLKSGSEPIVSSNRHVYISQVLSFLEESGGGRITSKQLAERFHVSRNKLEADFKQATGRTIYAFRAQLQLQHARVLLITTNQSLVEIANVCGFTDQSHLIRSFRKRYGVTPGAFREQYNSSTKWLK